MKNFGCNVVLMALFCLPMFSKGSTYHYMYHWLTWNEAHQVCEGINGNLASLTNDDVEYLKEFQQSVWQGHPYSDVWVGLTEQSDGSFRWTDCIEYNAILHPSKNSTGQCELCYVMKVSDWTLGSASCNSYHSFICQLPTPVDSCSYQTIQKYRFLGVYQVSNLNSSGECGAYCDTTPDCSGYYLSQSPLGQSCTLVEILSLFEANTSSTIVLTQRNCYSGYSVVAEMVSHVDTSGITINADLKPMLVCPALTAANDSCLISPTPAAVTPHGYLISSEEYHRVKYGSGLVVYNVICRKLYSPSTSCSTPSPVVSMTTAYSALVTTPACVTSEVMWIECDKLNGASKSRSSEELNQVVDEIVANLTVDKSSTTAYKDKYICRQDSRPSAAAVGTLGAVILSIPILVILILDFPRLANFFRKIYRRRRKLCAFKPNVPGFDPSLQFGGLKPIYACDVIQTPDATLEDLLD